MGGNPIQFDYTVILTLLFPMLFFFIFFVFVIYLMVSAIRFFKRKEVIDKALLQKLDELIKLQTHQSKKNS
ncbi:hypothetical protein E4K67_05905 [Desulfosporosinus fructosivorans]|uniref:DUF4083 domain-containing protein n=1 Tax=Desulfosporosinus fructosivorans TaxID=2018669 RepID=A0A4Z0R758_9FIRM|nr:hypothetical protein E4K67_05905 [Desulfosporosinus fructosivorans]